LAAPGEVRRKPGDGVGGIAHHIFSVTLNPDIADRQVDLDTPKIGRDRHTLSDHGPRRVGVVGDQHRDSGHSALPAAVDDLEGQRDLGRCPPHVGGGGTAIEILAEDERELDLQLGFDQPRKAHRFTGSDHRCGGQIPTDRFDRRETQLCRRRGQTNLISGDPLSRRDRQVLPVELHRIAGVQIHGVIRLRGRHGTAPPLRVLQTSGAHANPDSSDVARGHDGLLSTQ